VGCCGARTRDAQNDRSVRLGKEGSKGNVKVGCGGGGAGNRGSERIYSGHTRISNNAA
jgi:hypothetical protein